MGHLTEKMRDIIMKHTLITLTAVAVALASAACTTATQRQQYARAAAEVQGSVKQLREAAAKASSAKVRVMLDGVDREKEFPVPPEEFACMRGILAHTAAAPPALETEDESAMLHFFIELVLADARGVELTGVTLNTEHWMRESEARRLSPSRSRSSRVPEWCLPDADYELFCSLPTIPRAKEWGLSQTTPAH